MDFGLPFGFVVGTQWFDIEWAHSHKTSSLPPTFTLRCGDLSSTGNQIPHAGRTCWSVFLCGAATATSNRWTSGIAACRQSLMRYFATVAAWKSFSLMPTNSKSYQRYTGSSVHVQECTIFVIQKSVLRYIHSLRLHGCTRLVFNSPICKAKVTWTMMDQGLPLGNWFSHVVLQCHNSIR